MMRLRTIRAWWARGAEAEILWNGRTEHGESPIWVEWLGCVLVTDPKTSRLIAVEVDTGTSYAWSLPEPWYWIVARAGGTGFAAGLADRIVTVAIDLPDGPVECETVFRLGPDHRGVRFNDAKLGPHGRLFAGTMDVQGVAPLGRFYCFDPDGVPHGLPGSYTIPNGPAISGDGRLLYLADSAEHIVYVFDLAEDGAPRNRRIHLRFRESDGAPDGMTCDREGGLWIAHWGTGRISRFRPDGSRDRLLRLPVRGTTSLCFFGPALDRLAVTTSASVAPRQRGAGAIFTLRPGVAGLPSSPLRPASTNKAG